MEVSVITDLMINEQIRDKEVRLISDTGEQVGIVSSKDARKMAEEKQLDLVKISPQAKPPVCKIMDYSKYKFDQAKKEKEARKKQKTVSVKELRLSPNIDTHDVQVKVKNAIKFLKEGNKVKISIRFRGGLREELLGQRPARYECNLLHEVTAGCHNPASGKAVRL